MFDLNTLTKKNIEDLKNDLILKKKYILKNLKDSHTVLSLPNKKPFCEMSLNTNNGDIRSLTLYAEVLDEKKKKITLRFHLEDYTITSGKFVDNVDNKTNSLFNGYPTAWQNFFFQHKQYFSLYKINNSEEVKVYDTNIFDNELKDLFNLIYLTSEERKNSFINENLENRIASFKEVENKSQYNNLKNIDKNNIKTIEPIFKNENDDIKETSWNNSRRVIYDKKNKKIEFIEKNLAPNIKKDLTNDYTVGM